MPKVAAAQMISSASVTNNLQNVENFFREAAENQVDLLVLPENFALMGMQDTDKLQIAEQYQRGEIQDKLSQLSKKYKLWIVAGTIPLQANQNRVRASSLVFDDKGSCVARYDKIHLFDVRVSNKEAHQESLTVERGNELVVVETPAGILGLTVCYDLRFPELHRELVTRGAEIISVPSAFTAVTGMAHWEILLRARAIENLCYIVAANQGGLHQNGRETYGHSMIVEPWGKIVAKCETGEALVMASIDLERMRELRQRFPSNEHHVLLTT